jgi:hypothetical protein
MTSADYLLGLNVAIKMHRCVNAIDIMLEDFKKANDYFKDKFDVVGHSVIVFTQLLFPVFQLPTSSL